MRLNHVVRQGVNLLLYSHVWIAVCATAMTLQTGILLAGRMDWTPLAGFVAAGTWLAYTLHRFIAPTVQPNLQAAPRFQAIGGYARGVRWAVIPVIVFGVVCFLHLPPAVRYALAIPAAVALLYPIPVYRGRRLRDVPFLKLFLIAATWAWITVAGPALLRGIAITEVAYMLLERASFMLALAMPFDIRDVESDRAQGVATLPVRVGIHASKILAYCSLGIMVAAVYGNLVTTVYRPEQAAWLWMSALLTALVVYGAHPQREDAYFTGGIDGLMLVQAAGCLWVTYWIF